MRNYFFVSFELAIIALVTGSMLTGQPLWTKAAPVAASTPTALAQIH